MLSNAQRLNCLKITGYWQTRWPTDKPTNYIIGPDIPRLYGNSNTANAHDAKEGKSKFHMIIYLTGRNP